jgi:hypothetical protein
MDETKLFKKFSPLVLLATFFQCLKLQADDIGISELRDLRTATIQHQVKIMFMICCCSQQENPAGS